MACLPLFTQQFPEVVDFCAARILLLPRGGGVNEKGYAGHAKRVMMGVWSYLRQFMYTKFVIVVDDTIDARNWTDVIWQSTRPAAT